MIIIDADKFLAYLIFSKHIDGLTCGEVKEAIEMCKVDVLDKIRAEIIENSIEDYKYHGCGTDELIIETSEVLQIIDEYKAEWREKCK